MGHPKQQTRKYATPVKPYDKERIEKEKGIVSSYGLRRKKELWRAESILRNLRRRARSLQASPDKSKEQELFAKLAMLGINVKSLDEVLGIPLEQILDRRLQSVVAKKGLANTMKHSRQLITHGHVMIDGRKARWPSYLVPTTQEASIKLEESIAAKIIAKLNESEAKPAEGA
ncbi:MAG: 30S ribosomal protein S4 [Candidatus Aenigmarchaeota archaeon]|nr:30S ribosomal protein S4 [Candidatus Aenigmarchaeota archaeon]